MINRIFISCLSLLLVFHPLLGQQAYSLPDKDKDGVADADDLCPDLVGLAEFQGCPAIQFSDRRSVETPKFDPFAETDEIQKKSAQDFQLDTQAPIVETQTRAIEPKAAASARIALPVASTNQPTPAPTEIVSSDPSTTSRSIIPPPDDPVQEGTTPQPQLVGPQPAAGNGEVSRAGLPDPYWVEHSKYIASIQTSQQSVSSLAASISQKGKENDIRDFEASLYGEDAHEQPETIPYDRIATDLSTELSSAQVTAREYEARSLFESLKIIRFDMGETELDREAQLQLDKLSLLLRNYPEYSLVAVGYADEHHGERDVERISTVRANRVKNYLQYQKGFPGNRIKALGYSKNDVRAGDSEQNHAAVGLLLIKSKSNL